MKVWLELNFTLDEQLAIIHDHQQPRHVLSNIPQSKGGIFIMNV